MTVFGAALTILAVVLWLMLVATVATINQSDAAGRGMSQGFAMIFAVVLWVLLAGVTLLAASGGNMPGWVAAAALVLLPLSLAATMATIGLLANRGAGVSGWPIVVPVMIPLLVIAYAALVAVPSLRTLVPLPLASRVVWIAVLALSLVPWPLRRARASREEITEAQREANTRAMADSETARLEAIFQALTPETPLRDWLDVAVTQHELRERALAGIRSLPTRQAQAESLRGDDQAMLMSELRNLDLQATPALCRTANEFLVAHAESYRAKAATTARYEIEGASLEQYLFGMQWLASHGCDVCLAIDATDAVVRLYPTAPAREQFLARLASMRVAAR